MSLLFALSLLAAPASEAFAVVVANVESVDRDLPRLSFADDDGARWYELLSTTAKTRVLSVLDADSQRIFPDVAKVARVPTRSELERALDETFAEISKARGRGARTSFYFVFAGHGSVGDDGQGYVHLMGDRFTRSDLFQRVVARSPATVNHVVIDACNAYFMVQSRGSDDDAALLEFLGREDPERYANTGFLVSTSKAAEVHEWSRISAGIFSHEVRSAMAGAADVNEDGKVSYDEVQAFIAAANSGVKDPRARLAIHATPPKLNLAEPLFDRALARAPSLLISPELAGRFWLEDERGVRYLDSNMSSEAKLTVTLVPASAYFLRTEKSEIRIPLFGSGLTVARNFPKTPPSVVYRGSEEVTFQTGLFRVPFGPGFVQGFKASGELSAQTEREADAVTWRAPVALGAWGGAALSLAGGLVAGAVANDKATDYRTGVGTRDELATLRSDSQSAATAANVLFAVAGGLALSGAILWFW